MSGLPGHLEWHAPLALLAPGLWLVASAACAVLVPRGRGRALCAWAALAWAALTALAGWRAAWVLGTGTGAGDGPLGTWQRELLGGWVHGGLPWLVAGVVLAVLALAVAWPGRVTPDRPRGTKDWPLRLFAAGVGQLALVGLPWSAQAVLGALLLATALMVRASALQAAAGSVPDHPRHTRRTRLALAAGALLLAAGLATGVLAVAGA